MSDRSNENEARALNVLEKYPAILAKMLAKSSAFLGEIIVAERLGQMGYAVVPTNNNSRQMDLIATSPKGMGFGIEVKTGMQKRPTWFVNSCPDVEASRIWCLVAAPRAPQDLPDFDTVEVFVLTVAEAKRFGAAHHPVTSNLVQYAVGAVCTFPAAWFIEHLQVRPTWSLAAAMLYVVIGNSLVAMTLLLAMIRAGEVSRVSSLFYLVPGLSALFAWPMLGEALPPLGWAGMAVAATGVALASHKRKPG